MKMCRRLPSGHVQYGVLQTFFLQAVFQGLKVIFEVWGNLLSSPCRGGEAISIEREKIVPGILKYFLIFDSVRMETQFLAI